MHELPWQSVIEEANRDGEFRVAARLWNGILRFDLGQRSVELTIAEGVIRAATRCDRARPCDASVSGPLEEWALLLEPVPTPTHQDLFAGILLGRFQPERFLEYLRPILAEIRGRGA